MRLDVTTCKVRRDVAHRRGERGSVLVIVLLLILTLTAIGLVGLKHTSFELRTSRNQKLNKQASYISEGALVASIDRVGSNGQAYYDLHKRWTQALNAQALADGEVADNKIFREIPRDEIFPNRLMFAGASQTLSNCDQSSLPEDCQGLESEGGYYADADRLPNFVVRVENPKDGPKVEGFSNNFCAKSFTFTAEGTVGQAPTETDVLQYNQSVQGSAASHRAVAVVGPMECAGVYR